MAELFMSQSRALGPGSTEPSIDGSYSLYTTVSVNIFKQSLRWHDTGASNAVFYHDVCYDGSLTEAIGDSLSVNISGPDTSVGYIGDLAVIDQVNGLTFDKHVVSLIAWVIVGSAKNRFAISNCNALESNINANNYDLITSKFLADLSSGDGDSLLRQVAYWDQNHNVSVSARFNALRNDPSYATINATIPYNPVPFEAGDVVWFKVSINGTGPNGSYQVNPQSNVGIPVTPSSQNPTNPGNWLIRISLD